MRGRVGTCALEHHGKHRISALHGTWPASLTPARSMRPRPHSVLSGRIVAHPLDRSSATHRTATPQGEHGHRPTHPGFGAHGPVIQDRARDSAWHLRDQRFVMRPRPQMPVACRLKVSEISRSAPRRSSHGTSSRSTRTPNTSDLMRLRAQLAWAQLLCRTLAAAPIYGVCPKLT